MARSLIVYGSTTGNTEILSGFVADGMKEAGIDVTIKDVVDTDISELQSYDIIALGSSTWGDGELQDDFIPFYDKMEGISLAGKKACAFGPGDSSYGDAFCLAVDLLQNRLKECGANVVTQGFKVDGDVEPAEDGAREWGRQAASMAIA